MAEVPEYPNNSSRAREERERKASKYQKIKPNMGSEADDISEDRPKLESVVAGGAHRRRRSITKRFRENFLSDDVGSVWTYLTYDVVVPGVKNLMFEMVRDGFERLLWGDSRPRRRHGPSGYTSYDSMYSSKSRDSDRNRDRDRDRDRPTAISNQARKTHAFDEILIENRGEAEEVIDRLIGLVDNYGTATVSDLYDLVGVTSDYTDQKWGWSDLALASVRGVRGGYILDLPRPIVID